MENTVNSTLAANAYPQTLIANSPLSTRSGAVHINCGGFNQGSPVEDYTQSGNGRECDRLRLEDCQEVKTLHFG